MNVYRERVQALRALMREARVDAYLIWDSDPHLSEYVPSHYKARSFVSGFEGSAGVLLITQDVAHLWTDARYWIGAERALEGSGITLQKQDRDNTLAAWLRSQLAEEHRLGVDLSIVSWAWMQELSSRATIVDLDLITPLWRDRPPLPSHPIFPHRYSSLGVREKLGSVREAMSRLGADWHLISSLDDVAWLSNLRGSDVEYNPLFLAHLLLTPSGAILFADGEIEEGGLEEGFELRAYGELSAELAGIRGGRMLIDPQRINASLKLDASVQILRETNPSVHLKACKSPQEIRYIQEAMVEDGVALCGFFAWLEGELAREGGEVDELLIDSKLAEFRGRSPDYVSDSFATIAGFNANGALPHYQANPESNASIQGDGLLLIDSGGQYLKGTTDITRVVPIGVPSAEQIRDYTLVLKAHIAIARAVFPDGIAMPLLDTLARAPLWAEQLDYRHGTGHGVGYFLNVHEGPQVLSYFSKNPTGVREGMLTSIEPGIYREGQWGVRLENLVLCVRVEPNGEGCGGFLGFESMTLCPFEPSCIDMAMLDARERQWLEEYHQRVYEKLAPRLSGAALEWLEKRVADKAGAREAKESLGV